MVLLLNWIVWGTGVQHFNQPDWLRKVQWVECVCVCVRAWLRFNASQQGEIPTHTHTDTTYTPSREIIMFAIWVNFILMKNTWNVGVTAPVNYTCNIRATSEIAYNVSACLCISLSLSLRPLRLEYIIKLLSSLIFCNDRCVIWREVQFNCLQCLQCCTAWVLLALSSSWRSMHCTQFNLNESKWFESSIRMIFKWSFNFGSNTIICTVFHEGLRSILNV